MANPRDSGLTPDTEAIAAPPAALAGCRLRVVAGPDEGKELDLVDGTVTVGSSDACDFQLSDPTVSSRHLDIRVVPLGIAVSDLKSRNGTYYLATRIEAATLTHGAVLTVGRSRLGLLSRRPQPGADYKNATHYGAIRGATPGMQRLYALLEKIESLDYPVLIQGETGVGKDLVANEIHAHSKRRDHELQVFDCGAVPATLIENELFGHVRGAFTGAEAAHAGILERADQSTLFLDEVGELPLELQPKLLRALEAGEIRRVGGSGMTKVDVRVVAATNRDLAARVKAKAFREDLYFRLNVIRVDVPPLRERREDIPMLVRHVLESRGHADVDIAPDTMELLTCGYDWPGNVRELAHAVIQAVCLGTTPAGLAAARDKPATVAAGADQPFLVAKRRVVDAFERDYLLDQLKRANHNIAHAARAAGVDRAYFKRILKRHGLLVRGRQQKADE
ncbi:MAG: sigma 54-dependent Fis family transcriptional regulator [Deltaproteobacteria bacterium]|nr:sigma 54-dependent Fis family transcriptional regulator [Deltaproteobacteria bacterium]